MQKCGFCSMVSGLFRRAACIRSRRGSSESYYRELGDQDTLKIEDRSSDFTDDADEELNQEDQPAPAAPPPASPSSAPPSPESPSPESPAPASPSPASPSPASPTLASPTPASRTTASRTPASRTLASLTPVPERPPWPGTSQLSLPEDPGSPQKTPLEQFPELYQIKRRNLADCKFLTTRKKRKKQPTTRSLSNDTGIHDALLLIGPVATLLEQSVCWPFNAFFLDFVSGGRCLPVFCVHLFNLYGLISHFELDPAKIWKLFHLIEEGYHSSNPYHNSIHAADVTQAMHCFLQQKEIRDHLDPLEIMASLLAAIAHDLDHPGVNQNFLIATSDFMADLYNNTSVLENHHRRAAVSCLIQSGVLDHMPHELQKVKDHMSALILATDISRQHFYLSRFKGHLDTNTLDMTNSEHRLLVLQIALKCADISNPCRPWDISEMWSLKVCEEFFRQGDSERELNLPVSDLCNRHAISIPKIQKGFFNYVVTPLITEWDRFLKNDLSAQMHKNLLYNQNRWELMVNEEDAQDSITEITDADLVEYNLETSSGSDLSDDSVELLLPNRRNSLNTTKPSGLIDQLRRLSVPLNLLHDTKLRKKENATRASSLGDAYSLDTDSECLSSSEHSLHLHHSVQEQCESPRLTETLSSKKPIPESSIAFLRTPSQPSRLNFVLKDGVPWKLVRQQTFPPLEMTREYGLATRPLYTSNEDAIFSPRYKIEYTRLLVAPSGDDKNVFRSHIVRTINNSETESTSQANEGTSEPPLVVQKKNKFAKGRRDAASVGSQLRDNLASFPLGLDSDPLLHQRKSMPSDAGLLSPNEKKVREVTPGLPELLRRTLSGKDSWTRRRGSAPLPIVPSELRGLVSMGPLHLNPQGGRRKPNPVVSWLARTSFGVQELPYQQLPRRSSLPVEVMTVITTH